MAAAAENSVRPRAVAVASHLLCGFGLLPILVYTVGEAIVGPYAGMRGLASFLGSIYGDLFRFKPEAWILVTTPSLIVGIWYCAIQLQRYLLGDESGSKEDSS